MRERLFLARSVEWHRTLPHTVHARRLLARALYFHGELDEAAALFEELAAGARGRVQPIGPGHLQLSAHLDEGFCAAIAARRGDGPALEKWSTVLKNLDGPYLYGAHWYWLAVVAAIAGDADAAVRLLGRAFADGMPMELFLHTDPHFETLRPDPRFQGLVRPRS